MYQRPPTRPILLVDDDLDHRFACRDLLEANGYIVQEAGDGRKALAMLGDPARVLPCLVILDLSMPLMDGWQFLGIMKGQARLSAIPVVLVSAQDPQLDPALEGTIAAHIRKPCNGDDLLALAAKFRE